ncbi:MAG: AhpC/TSA family protein, partial [Balneola sp.]
LYLSNAINDNEPELFSEPGLFLIRPDGELYYSAINSMPFGRPVFKDMLRAIDFIQENDYPARGEVNAMELQD